MYRTRRDFLKQCALGGAYLAAGQGMLLPELCLGKGHDVKVEAQHYKRLPGNRIQCHVCPLHCTLESGQTCFCRTRTNHNGVLYNHAYNSPCILNVDPIEKTPLTHFLPGTRTLAIGLAGCNMRCLYCQNWQVSQEAPVDTRNLRLSSHDVCTKLAQQDLPTVALTYTEPVAFFEYAKEVAHKARQAQRKAVMASGAFLETKPMQELCRHLDGMCLALKGFSEIFYKKVCGVSMAPVLRAIKTAVQSNAWCEITTLIIPTYNDAAAEIRLMCRWIMDHLGPDIPLHFARFVPEYKLRKLPQTPVSTLENCRRIAMEEGIHYVYLSNVAPHPANHTYCPQCGELVIKRVGFRVLTNHLSKGHCPRCRSSIPGVWS